MVHQYFIGHDAPVSIQVANNNALTQQVDAGHLTYQYYGAPFPNN